MMELKLDTREWEYLVPLVQANLNHTPVASLGGKSPMVPPAELVDKLRQSLAGMHHEVQDLREKSRLANMQQSRGSPCNFTVSDFVLWSRIDSRLSVNKLLTRWVGPFEVIEELPHSFVIRHLLPDQRHNVHGSRLKFYCDASLGVSEEMRAHVGNQGMVLGVEARKDHHKQATQWQLLVSWIGLQEEEDSWESLDAMHDDLTIRVREYVDASGDEALKRAYFAITQRD
ncbi:unnamed protein product [Phytophthora fragariaefolia]|uniref:Unnamed protein product n=1 Tax=Phytophthora fragariaefolia TaxID=1490495 RepID=A0A9W6TLQ3_9STRA|nr:unnamed protein product [Phytophthora fragariaefolia]